MLTAIALFRWWYGSGWLWPINHGKQQVSELTKQFSIKILLKTLGAPWKQIISSPGQISGLDNKIRAFIDNLVSRIVGFCVRLVVLCAALILILFWAIVSICLVLAWPFIPILPLGLVVLSAGLL